MENKITEEIKYKTVEDLIAILQKIAMSKPNEAVWIDDNCGGLYKGGTVSVTIDKDTGKLTEFDIS